MNNNMKEIKRLRFKLKCLFFLYIIIPIILHKPFKLEIVADKLATKLNDIICKFNKPNECFEHDFLKPLIPIKKLDVERFQYLQYLIMQYNEQLVKEYNQILTITNNDNINS